VTLLSRAVARDTLPPSLLFSGPAGVGKRRAALAIAEALNCLQPRAGGPGESGPEGQANLLERDACGECVPCRRVARGVHPDVILIEPADTGTIKIDQIRDVIERAGYRPFEGRRRVVVIDEADSLMPAAQHALLKTLEEPPSASIFILVSSMPDALLPTVRSRCQRLRFGSLTAAEVATALIRDHEYGEADAHAAAADADGSIGRALESQSVDLIAVRAVAQRLLEQTARQSDPVALVRAAQELAGGKGSPASEREQLAVLLRTLASLLRDLGILSSRGDASLIANVDLQTALSRLTGAFDTERSSRAFAAVDQALAALERNASPKLVADWLVLQL
jgi:DNA polymerase III subunit delta'